MLARDTGQPLRHFVTKRGMRPSNSIITTLSKKSGITLGSTS